MPLDATRCSKNEATKSQKRIPWLLSPQNEFLSASSALKSCSALGIPRQAARLLTALQHDVKRREVKLSLTGCGPAEGRRVAQGLATGAATGAVGIGAS